uniref:Uncharacterized protein n=1 Tax=Megaselia scalaris TaxID=36166 RepID=T1H569_MEGSC
MWLKDTNTLSSSKHRSTNSPNYKEYKGANYETSKVPDIHNFTSMSIAIALSLGISKSLASRSSRTTHLNLLA